MQHIAAQKYEQILADKHSNSHKVGDKRITVALRQIWWPGIGSTGRDRAGNDKRRTHGFTKSR
nr:MAG TPA: hypothetical protein [Caudoviricetes sp.]